MIATKFNLFSRLSEWGRGIFFVLRAKVKEGPMVTHVCADLVIC